MLCMQWQYPGIELLLTNFSFETGDALLPDRAQGLPVPKYMV